MSEAGSDPYRTFVWFVPAMLLVTVVSLLTWWVPGFQVLGHETAALHAGLLFLVGTIWGASAVARLGPPRVASFKVLRGTPWQDLNRAIALRFRGGVWLAAIPVALAVARQLFVQPCRVHPELGTYVLFVLPALVLGLAGGACAAALFASRWARFLFVAALVGASALHSAAIAYLGPRVVVHNLILGLLSTDGYTGAGVDLGVPLLIRQRLFALLLAATLWCASGWFLAFRARERAGNFSEEPEGEERLRRELSRDVRRYGMAGAGLLLAVAAFLIRPDTVGLGTGTGRLDRQLSHEIVTRHIRLHHGGSSPVARHAPRIAWMSEWWVRDLAERLDVSPTPIDIWLYEDVEEMGTLTGARGFLFAQPWKQALHVRIRDGQVPALDHELVHVVAGSFGPPPLSVSWKPGLVEGLAVALEHRMDTDPAAHAEAAAALEAGHLPRPEEFLGLLGFGRSSMRRSYAAAGSFVGFLLHEYGAGRFREAYWTNDVASSYDKSLPQLDEEWRSFLAQVPFTPQAKERAAVRYDPAVNVPFYRTACPRVGSLDAVARLRFRGWEAWRSGLPSTAEQDLCRVALLDPAHFGHELLVFSRQRLFLHSDPVGLQGLELLAKRPGWLGREALLSLYRWGKETGSKELQEGSLEELVERGYLERALAAQLSPAPAGSGWESSEGGSGAPRVPELIRLLHPEFQFESREISLAERREATERLARETGFAEARIRALLRLSEMEFVQGDVAAARVRLESILPQLAGTRREARWRQRLARWRFVEQSLAAGDPPGASNTVTSGREADRARL